MSIFAPLLVDISLGCADVCLAKLPMQWTISCHIENSRTTTLYTGLISLNSTQSLKCNCYNNASAGLGLKF